MTPLLATLASSRWLFATSSKSKFSIAGEGACAPLLFLNCYGRTTVLLLHALRPEPASLADDASENVRDTLLIQRPGVLFHHAGQDLTLSIAVVCGQARGHLDRSNFTGDGGTLV